MYHVSAATVAVLVATLFSATACVNRSAMLAAQMYSTDSATIHIVALKGDSAFERAVRAALPYMRFAAAALGDLRPVIVETSAKFTTTHYH